MEKELKNSQSRRCWLVAFCTACLVAIVTLIMSMRGLSPIDDHVLVKSLFQGKPLPMYIKPDLGRFMPATAEEYDIAARLFGPAPFLFHFVGALKVIVCGVLLLIGLLLTKIKNYLIAVLWASAIFSIAFANSAFRLQVGEINALTFLLVFIATTIFGIRFMEPDRHRNRILDFAGLLSLVAAFFYKESIFVLTLSFGVAEALRYYRNEMPVPRRIVAVILLSIAYFAGYGVWHHYFVTGSYANFHAAGRWEILTSYATNDPVMIFAVVPLTLFRLVGYLKNHKTQTVYDSLLLAACTFVAAYLVLGMFNTYYLLPAYGFALCGIAGLCSESTTIQVHKKMVAIFVGILTINTLPIALSDMQSLRSISNNYSQFVENISNWIWINHKSDAKPTKLVLSGISTGNGVEVVISLRRFLKFQGLPKSLFEVEAELPSTNKTISTFYKFKNEGGYTSKAGDVVIFNPYQEIFKAPPLQTPSFETIFREEQDWEIPRLTAIDWAEACLLQPASCSDRAREKTPHTTYTALLVLPERTTGAIGQLKSPSFELGPLQLPERMHAGDRRQLKVLVRNTGTETWPVASPASVVHLSYVWLDSAGHLVLEGGRSQFAEPIHPGDIAGIELALQVPVAPGRYKLIISPVQEGVSWFYSVQGGGSETASREIEIYPSLARRVLSRLHFAD